MKEYEYLHNYIYLQYSSWMSIMQGIFLIKTLLEKSSIGKKTLVKEKEHIIPYTLPLVTISLKIY